jgi:hypothetical protein
VRGRRSLCDYVRQRGYIAERQARFGLPDCWILHFQLGAAKGGEHGLLRKRSLLAAR